MAPRPAANTLRTELNWPETYQFNGGRYMADQYGGTLRGNAALDVGETMSLPDDMYKCAKLYEGDCPLQKALLDEAVASTAAVGTEARFHGVRGAHRAATS